MALFLFFQALLQGFHQLVPAHFFDGGFLFGCEFVFKGLFKPLQRHVGGEVGQHFHAFEIGAKGFIELIEMLFVLHQNHATEVVKIIHAAGVAVGADHIGLQRFQKGEVFLDRHRQFGRAQGVEKINQHGKPLSMGKQAFDG